jgi:hypothetical protein
VFLAVIAFSLVTASMGTVGRPDVDDRNSEFLEYFHNLAVGAELKKRRNPWPQSMESPHLPSTATGYPIAAPETVKGPQDNLAWMRRW